MRYALVVLSLFIQNIVTAQSTGLDTAVLKREYNPFVTQAALNFHLFSLQGHQWYTQVIYSGPEYFFYDPTFSYRYQIQTGYEFKASDHWRVALGVKANISTENPSTFILPRFSLAHHGTIFKLDFIKEFNAELSYDASKNKTNVDNLTLISGQFGLGKSFKIGSHSFYSAMSYKLYLVLVEKNSFLTSLYANRRFDWSQFRVDFQYVVNPQIRIGLYGVWDTHYYYTEGTSGGSTSGGDPIPPQPAARVNQITPMLGLQLHYILKGDRREGYLPLWPSK